MGAFNPFERDLHVAALLEQIAQCVKFRSLPIVYHKAAV